MIYVTKALKNETAKALRYAEATPLERQIIEIEDRYEVNIETVFETKNATVRLRLVSIHKRPSWRCCLRMTLTLRSVGDRVWYIRTPAA